MYCTKKNTLMIELDFLFNLQYEALQNRIPDSVSWPVQDDTENWKDNCTSWSLVQREDLGTVQCFSIWQWMYQGLRWEATGTTFTLFCYIFLGLKIISFYWVYFHLYSPGGRIKNTCRVGVVWRQEKFWLPTANHYPHVGLSGQQRQIVYPVQCIPGNR